MTIRWTLPRTPEGLRKGGHTREDCSQWGQVDIAKGKNTGRTSEATPTRHPRWPNRASPRAIPAGSSLPARCADVAIEYKPELPPGTKLPPGFSVNTNDPRYKALHDLAVRENLSQRAFSSRRRG